MDAQQIKAFIDAMAASDLTELEATKDGWTLRLVRSGKLPQEPEPSLTASLVDGAYEQCAALSGVVFLQPAAGEPAFAQPGAQVKAGQTLCVIEAMKVFNEVQAERDGFVDTFLVVSGQEVAADQPLVRLR